MNRRSQSDENVLSAALDWAAERVSAAIVESAYEPEQPPLARVASRLLR
jgi:hypothetical protein